ncbi:hypothetical protein A7K94_0203995 [Modestobacter sp. VKM Ac-2676]|nr:hypothetical protein A7K94_0203995 [Modestobacter sp. VKM Ac-2676]
MREALLASGYRVTTFEHRPQHSDWRSVVACVDAFIARRAEPVALVGWSQGAAIAQEAALAAGERVQCAALLATYGRQNEMDRILQRSWDRFSLGGADLDSLRLALGLLTAFPPDRLADDEFVLFMGSIQPEWAGMPDAETRRRSADFIATYQERLQSLAGLDSPCLVMGYELDTDTFAARAQEVADALPNATYLELPGLGHAAPISDPDRVWPPVVAFLAEHHPVR